MRRSVEIAIRSDHQWLTKRDLVRHCADVCGHVQNNRKAIVSDHRRCHADHPVSTS